MLVHRVEHRWLSLGFLGVGGILGLSPLVMAVVEGYADWVRPFTVWAAACFGPCFLAALFYIGRTNALTADTERRVLAHVLGVYAWARTRAIPFDDVSEVRHATVVTRHKGRDMESHYAEIVHAGGVIRYADDEQATLAGRVARLVGRPLRRTRGPSQGWRVFGAVMIGIGVVALAAMLACLLFEFVR